MSTLPPRPRDLRSAAALLLLMLAGLGSADAPEGQARSRVAKTAWAELHGKACTGNDPFKSALPAPELNPLLDPKIDPTRGVYGFFRGSPAFGVDADTNGFDTGADARRWYPVAAEVFCDSATRCEDLQCTQEQPLFGYRARVVFRETAGGGWVIAAVAKTDADRNSPDRDQKGKAEMALFDAELAKAWPLPTPPVAAR